MSRKLVTKGAVFLLGTMAIFAVVKDEMSAPLLFQTLRGKTNYFLSSRIYVPPSLDADSQRRLTGTLDLGGGNCEWEDSALEVPEEIDFHKTLIAGYPSGDKRMIFVQMEALTGWPAKDEWDFQFLGYTNNPFIKANYPHHEGIWGWGDVADQMVLMIRNIRKSLVEYHDILWDIDYAKTWEEATLTMDQLYGERASIEEFLVWRDDRVIDEVQWYGWEIDYWMEGGLLRDMFSHGITTAEHFKLIMDPVNNHRSDLEDFYATKVAPGVANGTIGPTYDTQCANGAITDGCAPVEILSAEKLRDYTAGPAETEKIANVLLKDSRTGQYVIAQEAWNCVWEELIVNGQGLKTVFDRPGFDEGDYAFSEEMLDLMVRELDRLITKYSSPEWNTKATANRVVELLSEHRVLIQAELIEVQSSVTGVRQLTDRDFLGRKERKRRRQLKQGNSDAGQELKDRTEYFNTIWQKASEKRGKRRREMILSETKSRLDAATSAGKAGDEEFIQSLSNAVSQIRALEASGGTDQSTRELLGKIKQMVMEARSVLDNSEE